MEWINIHKVSIFTINNNIHLTTKIDKWWKMTCFTLMTNLTTLQLLILIPIISLTQTSLPLLVEMNLNTNSALYLKTFNANWKVISCNYMRVTKLKSWKCLMILEWQNVNSTIKLVFSILIRSKWLRELSNCNLIHLPLSKAKVFRVLREDHSKTECHKIRMFLWKWRIMIELGRQRIMMIWVGFSILDITFSSKQVNLKINHQLFNHLKIRRKIVISNFMREDSRSKARNKIKILQRDL